MSGHVPSGLPLACLTRPQDTGPMGSGLTPPWGHGCFPSWSWPGPRGWGEWPARAAAGTSGSALNPGPLGRARAGVRCARGCSVGRRPAGRGQGRACAQGHTAARRQSRAPNGLSRAPGSGLHLGPHTPFAPGPSLSAPLKASSGPARLSCRQRLSAAGPQPSRTL